MTTIGSTSADAAATQGDADTIFVGARAQELVEDADKIADALTALGDRVRAISKKLAHVDPVTGAVGVVADIQSDVMQGTGSIGPLLWTLIRDAGAYDRDRQAALSSARRGAKNRPGS